VPSDAGVFALQRVARAHSVSEEDALGETLTLTLSHVEKQALIALLKRTINEARFPYSPRLDPLRAILANLVPQPVREPLPPPKVYAPPRAKPGQRRGRR
jgi:hypothetical protein